MNCMVQIPPVDQRHALEFLLGVFASFCFSLDQAYQL